MTIYVTGRPCSVRVEIVRHGSQMHHMEQTLPICVREHKSTEVGPYMVHTCAYLDLVDGNPKLYRSRNILKNIFSELWGRSRITKHLFDHLKERGTVYS